MVINRDPQLVKVHRVSVECSALFVVPIPHTILQKVSNHVEEKAERFYKEEVIDDYKEIVFSRHSKAVAHMKVQ